MSSSIWIAIKPVMLLMRQIFQDETH